MIQLDFNGTNSVKSSFMARRYTMKVHGLMFANRTKTEIMKDLLWTTHITMVHKNLWYFTATLRKFNYSHMICMRCCSLSCSQCRYWSVLFLGNHRDCFNIFISSLAFKITETFTIILGDAIGRALVSGSGSEFEHWRLALSLLLVLET